MFNLSSFLEFEYFLLLISSLFHSTCLLFVILYISSVCVVVSIGTLFFSGYCNFLQLFLNSAYPLACGGYVVVLCCKFRIGFPMGIILCS